MAAPQDTQVTVERTLRPLRLAFLISPGDARGLERTFEFNSCVWGGMYNAIIPAYRRTPSWWTSEEEISARDIVDGYFNLFEPDYAILVSSGAHIPEGFPPDRIMNFAEVLNPESEEPIGIGTQAIELYEELYLREFQFERRHPVSVALVEAADRRMHKFVSAVWGSFPEELPHLGTAFSKAFGAESSTVDEDTFPELLSSRTLGPLDMGSFELDVLRGGPLWEPTFFVMDATSNVDLIDFWNLRAMGWPVTPAPVQWMTRAVPEYARQVRRNYRPYRWNPEIMLRTVLLKGRSLQDEGHLRRLAAAIGAENAEGLAIQNWYPRIWRPTPPGIAPLQRGEVTDRTESTEVAVRGSFISFPLLGPTFAKRVSFGDRPRWINVIRLRDYSPDPEFALVIPRDVPSARRLFEALGEEDVWMTSEGIVTDIRHSASNAIWSLPSPIQLFRHWAAETGYSFALSGAGKIAAQVIRAVGWGQAIANERLIQLLNDMASARIESTDEETLGPFPGKVVSVGQWRNQLQQMYDGNAERALNHLGYLVHRQVLEVGLRLQCPHCSQRNWYSARELQDALICRTCLQDFRFPATDPPREWFYRTIGPFSIGQYAGGAYCVALARRFFGITEHGELSWVPSFELTAQDGETMESDFGCFGAAPPRIKSLSSSWGNARRTGGSKGATLHEQDCCASPSPKPCLPSAPSARVLIPTRSHESPAWRVLESRVGMTRDGVRY